MRFKSSLLVTVLTDTFHIYFEEYVTEKCKTLLLIAFTLLNSFFSQGEMNVDFGQLKGASM